MRHNPKHAETDPAVVRRLIAENPWATLVSHAEGLVASHYPILLDEDSEELAVVTHVGRPDEEVHRFGGEEMLLIVAGPHGYISPSWYAGDDVRAPTWNFSVAHCYGVPQVLAPDDNLRVLTRLVAHFERHVEDPMWLDQELGARLARGTVGIRLPITRFICKVKMSQDKDLRSQRQVLAQLRGDGPYAQPALADDMERALRPAGDFDYEAGGHGYARLRRTDPRIAAYVHAALGDARTVLNVGAGAGSYEPEDRYVIAVEPSRAMRAQRTTPAVDAVAEALPFDDDSFDAAMATVTIHQWPDLERGLAELRRVARRPVVILAFDAAAMREFWLHEYVPELFAAERGRDPGLERVARVLGGEVTVTAVPIPIDCADGFVEAFYARPEALLDPAVRRAQSAWAFIDDAIAERGLARLRDALASGAWDARHGHLRSQAEYFGALRLVTAIA